jgi:coenzyme F420-reducing hydrogenase alpha subunit
VGSRVAVGGFSEEPALETPEELRELAKECRHWAESGGNLDREWRERFAEYLERRAVEIESGCVSIDQPARTLQ